MRVGILGLAALLTVTIFAGCIDSDVPNDPSLGQVDESLGYTLPETITGMEEMLNVQFDGVEDMVVDGIWFHDDILYTSGTALALVDVSDPTTPTTISMVDETKSRDVDIMEHPNGKLYAVLAGSPGVILVDVTDPENPVKTTEVEIGYHNIAVVPGTALVYNSRSLYREADVATEGGLVDIIDFTDPEEPKVTPWRMGHTAMTVGGIVKPVSAPACHDISVYPEVGRAYCAGVTETQVWDIEDPADPKILQVVHNPGTNIHHAAYPAKNHTLLVIGDELGGAALSPGCAVPDQAYGGVWFVDISDLSKPMPLGWWAPAEAHEAPVDPSSAPFVVPTCTAHFGNFVEDRDLMVMGFYTAGVFIVDFSDPANPVEVANYRPGGNVWEGQYYNGHIYTGDTARGVDVLKPTGDGEVFYGTGDGDA